MYPLLIGVVVFMVWYLVSLAMMVHTGKEIADPMSHIVGTILGGFFGALSYHYMGGTAF